MVSRTKTHVIVEAKEYEALVHQIGTRREAEAALRKSNRDVTGLLMLALHQLAGESGARDHAYFARRWIAKHRRLETGGIPIRNGFRPTCPYCGHRQAEQETCERCGKPLGGAA